MIRIAPKTLRTHYRRELDRGLHDANVRVAKRLFSYATEGEPRTAISACIFWLKTRAGFRETGDGVNLNVQQQQATHTLRKTTVRIPFPTSYRCPQRT